MGPEYTELKCAGEARGPAHGVRGGRLPQHLRVLGGPRGHLPHRRRPVHPALRLLPDRHRQARSRSTATSRAGWPSRCRRWACATPPSPASPATTCPTAARGCTPRRCEQIHALNPGTGVENLIPDFNGKPDLLAEVFDSRPEVLAHNVETVPRIFKRIRPAFPYERSLDVLTQARDFGLVTKSNLILGMGEERAEVSQALRDLHDAGCELITITQYLRPSPRHHPVEPLGQAGGVRRAAGRGRGDRLRRRACPGRWSARPTAPAGSTSRPSRPGEADGSTPRPSTAAVAASARSSCTRTTPCGQRPRRRRRWST